MPSGPSLPHVVVGSNVYIKNLKFTGGPLLELAFIGVLDKKLIMENRPSALRSFRSFFLLPHPLMA